MQTIELILHIPEKEHEFIVAELDDLGGLGYVQDNDQLKAYFEAEEWTPQKRAWLLNKLKNMDVDVSWNETFIPEQDWNEPWERSITPIQAGPFIVRPSWAEISDDHNLEEIIIDPKMSFGTGHHETTRLILEKLPGYIQDGDKVLDAGAGTAILAIAAIKLGAASAIAFDIDKWALENGEENIQLNSVGKYIDLRNRFFRSSP